MNTPSQLFDDYVDFEGACHQDNGDEDQYTSYYPNVPPSIDDSFRQATNPWDQPQDLMGRNGGYYAASKQDRAGDPYDAGDVHTESTTSDTRTPGRTSSINSSRHASSKTSKSSAPSTDSGSTVSSGKHRKGKHGKDKGKESAAAAASSVAAAAAAAAERGETKRDKFLERNRIAASKCRQKKKEWVNDLEETKVGLESQNSHLQMEYNGLMAEISRMKTQIMAHAGCNDPNIDKWIENEARRFVQSTSQRYGREQSEQRSGALALGAGYASYPGPPSYASSYQQDDGSQMSPTDMGFSPDGSLYMEPQTETRHHSRHGHRKVSSGHR